MCKRVNLLDSLLDAIVRLDGDALVMHVGEKPYVVTTSEATNEFRGPLAWGQVELSSRVLTAEAVVGMLGQILPIDQRAALDEYGATEYAVTATNHATERFTIVAARGGDDIWLELRRQPRQVEPARALPVAAEPPVVDVAAVAEPRDAQPDPEMAQPDPEIATPEPVAYEEPVVEPTAQAEPVPEPIAFAPETGPVTFATDAEPAIESIEVMDPIDSFEPSLSTAEPTAAEPIAIDTIDQEYELSLDDVPFEPAAIVQHDEPPLPELPLAEDITIPDFAELTASDLAAVDQDWGDDVMTEGELGELLRASAAAIIIGETSGSDADALPDAATTSMPTAVITLDNDPVSAFTGAPLLMEEEIVAAPAAFVEQLQPEQQLAHATYGVVIVTPEIVADDQVEVVQIEAEPIAAAPEPPAAIESPEPPSFDDGHVASPVAIEAVPSTGGGAAPAATTEQQESLTVSFNEVMPPAYVEPPASHRHANEPSLPEASVVGHHDSPAFGSEPSFAPLQDQLAGEQPSLPGMPLVTSAPVAAEESVHAESSDGYEQGTLEIDEDSTPSRPPAVVVPLARHGRGDMGDAKGSVAVALQRVLRLAASRGAATVYVVAQSAPMVRIDGEFSPLDGEPVLNAVFIDRLLAEVAPHARDGAAAPPAEWITDVPEIGRVRCVTFRDHRGPGVIFRMVPPRAISADQLALPAEVQALCTEADGLILVAGGRGSGRSTLLTSFVDLVNRSRSDHIITVEPQIDFVHENKRSFISQREIRGSGEGLAAAVRAACREEPDVLVIEDLRTPELVSLALEAAESGRLVFASVPAISASTALERIIEMFPADRREKAQARLATSLRGIISQVLLRKLRGGRVAAREVLINTPEVANLIAEGRASQLADVLDSGRRHGMMSFGESLAGLVREGAVHPSHAYRKAPDQEQFLSLLRRDGVDAAIAERLA
jgi:twitching motility protein PilT